MKKTFVFVIKVFIAIQLAAQFEWVGDFGQSSRTSGFYKTSNNQFVITRDTEDDAGFSVVDSSGKQVFNYSDPYFLNPDPSGGEGRLRDVYDFIELTDSSYLFILEEAKYDCQGTGIADVSYRLLKYDENWDEIDLSVAVIPTVFSPRQWASPLPDGCFLLLSSENELQKRNAQGEMIWFMNLPGNVTIIRDFLTISGDTTIIVTRDNSYTLDGQGPIIETLPYGFDRVKSATGNGFYGSVDDPLLPLCRFDHHFFDTLFDCKGFAATSRYSLPNARP